MRKSFFEEFLNKRTSILALALEALLGGVLLNIATRDEWERYERGKIPTELGSSLANFDSNEKWKMEAVTNLHLPRAEPLVQKCEWFCTLRITDSHLT